MDEIQNIQNKIYEFRGQRVMFDFDLSVMYGVETRRLNEQVKRNIERFPEDFMFQLTKGEFEILKSQIAISKFGNRRGGTKKLPYAFTENGVAMLSSVLHSSSAIQVNIRQHYTCSCRATIKRTSNTSAQKDWIHSVRVTCLHLDVTLGTHIKHPAT